MDTVRFIYCHEKEIIEFRTICHGENSIALPPFNSKPTAISVVAYVKKPKNLTLTHGKRL